MSRIRSVHPGLFTDEAFMAASPSARLLLIGLWCEAWDDGVFEWKPLTLKVRLFPIDTFDVGVLLDELERLNFLRRFEANGKAYGVIRNFQKWQRPKKPNSSGVLPAGLASFVAASGTSSEPVRNQFGTDVEPVLTGEEDGEKDVGKKGSAASVPNGTTAAVAKATAQPQADLAETDPEQWFWDRAADLEARGCVRSQFGALVQLHGGKWTSLIPTMRRVMAARNPSPFLHAMVADLRKDLAATTPSAPPPVPRRGQRGGEPDFVRSARAEGQVVKVIQRSNGEPGYRIGTETFDAAGREIGF